jgi:hypothetical protein
MPLIYRGMLRDGDHPEIGPSRKTLGAQVPGDLSDEEGLVKPKTGGMSVSPTWRDIPMHRMPRRLKHLAHQATGSNTYECWKMGEGPFQGGVVTEGLSLRLDKPKHGLVEPSIIMKTTEYQEYLARTCNLWIIEEQTRQ